MAGYNVGYFVGNRATKSINRSLAKALMRVAPPELQMTETTTTNYPSVATEFKYAKAAVDAVLFVTPE